jgi:hypothetical protein
MIPFNTELKAFVMSKLKNHPVKVKVKNALDTMDYNSTFALGCNSKLVWGKLCCKGIMKLKA